MKNNVSKAQKVLKNILWFALYIGIFYGASSWQQKDMLKTQEKLTSTQLNLLDMKGSVFEYQFDNSENDTLVYFFAPWCSVCHASIDNLEAIKQAQLENLTIFIVALDWRSVEEIESFLAEHRLSVPILLGTRDTQKNFKIDGFPSYYLIDRDGFVQAKSLGYSTELGMRVALSWFREES